MICPVKDCPSRSKTRFNRFNNYLRHWRGFHEPHIFVVCCPLCKEEEYSSRRVGDIKRDLKSKHGVHNEVKQDCLIKESRRMWKQNARWLPLQNFYLSPSRQL